MSRDSGDRAGTGDAVNAELLARYDRPGPRYTSYPTAVEFHEGVGKARYETHLARAAAGDGSIGFYVHLPFCAERCLYCGCNVVITKQRDVAARYLDVLEREIRTVGARLDGARPIVQYHWGGGTPTYYEPSQLRRLHGIVRDHFPFAPGAELAIEVDPRVTTSEHLTTLRELGFNRISAGVQDFDPDVLREINRMQDYEDTSRLLAEAAALGFGSTNLDLIYGLPRQTPESFSATMDRIVELRPGRLAIYSYAHVPWLKGHQRKMNADLLPAPSVKLELYATALARLTEAGYVPIGMDHFALPDDELARAARAGTLWRNFMGYTVRRSTELVACGQSGIGEVDGAFFQNRRRLVDYEREVAEDGLAVARGYVLTDEDRLRRDVIASLMCRFRLDFDEVGSRHGLDVQKHFARELKALAPMEADGLVERSADGLTVLDAGRLFIRNVCILFDEHLAARQGDKPRFSRTV